MNYKIDNINEVRGLGYPCLHCPKGHILFYYWGKLFIPQMRDYDDKECRKYMKSLPNDYNDYIGCFCSFAEGINRNKEVLVSLL